MTAKIVKEKSFKNNGNTGEVQGIRFEKNGYTFNGSKIDRQFSYSKINYQLKQNAEAQNNPIQKKHNYSNNQSSGLENVATALGGFFDFHSSATDYDPDEAALLRQHKKKKRNGDSDYKHLKNKTK